MLVVCEFSAVRYKLRTAFAQQSASWITIWLRCRRSDATTTNEVAITSSKAAEPAHNVARRAVAPRLPSNPGAPHLGLAGPVPPGGPAAGSRVSQLACTELRLCCCRCLFPGDTAVLCRCAPRRCRLIEASTAGTSCGATASDTDMTEAACRRCRGVESLRLTPKR